MDIFRAHELKLDEVYAHIYTHRMTHVPRYVRLKNYYDGRHDVLNRSMSDITKPNNRLVNNFPDYIVNQAAAYFMGTPVSYASQNDKLMEYIQTIFDYNDEHDINSQHAENLGIYGVSYELHYINKEDEVVDMRFAVVSPQEMFVVYNYDLTPQPLYAVRYYEIPDTFGSYSVEIYDNTFVSYYVLSGQEWQLTVQLEHFYSDVPVIEVINNNDRVGDFEKVLTLIDAYNILQSDSLNDFEYFSDAYLFLKGAILEPEEALNMKENRLINVMDSDADASFLVKNLQDEALENLKTRLVDDIHKFSSVPNLTDEQFSSNLSGVAIKYKLMGLENIAGKKERRFKTALHRRIELLTNLLYIRGLVPKSNYFDVQMTFRRTLPANVVEEVSIVKDLVDVVSTETLLGMLPFVDDPVLELDRIKEEKTQLNS